MFNINIADSLKQSDDKWQRQRLEYIQTAGICHYTKLLYDLSLSTTATEEKTQETPTVVWLNKHILFQNFHTTDDELYHVGWSGWIKLMTVGFRRSS